MARVSVLGPLEVVSGETVRLRRPAQRRLLSILSLSAGSRVSTDMLIHRFWPTDPPETSRAAIQTHISALRRALGDGSIATEGYGYRLVGEVEIDVVTFDGHARAASSSTNDRRWPDALAAAEAALDLWRGPPYQDLIDDEFAQPEIARLNETFLRLLETRAEALIALNRAEDVLPELEALVIEQPLRERLWEQLMTARYQLGRHVEALRAFQEVSDHLAEMGVEPGEPLRRLEEKILLHDQSLSQTENNLPHVLDEFIGRERELATIRDLLNDARLVSMVGAGGSGKTRLAIEAANSVLGRFPDGVFFIPLADIDDPELVPRSIADGIGLVTQPGDVMAALTDILSDRSALLLIDNCEHLVDSVAALAVPLLAAAPELRILTTSRESLRAQGEVTYVVPGMDVGADSDAVRLFAARAHQTNSGFDLTGNAEAMLRICQRLDGMPLAIELAARRSGAIALDDLDTRLSESSALLARGKRTGPPRHQTLEATIDWSYRLLEHDEQIALQQLSVFRGGFDLRMAEWLVGDDAATVVAGLVDRSLVTPYIGELSHQRYRLLETIRQYARKRLEKSDPDKNALNKHAEWCARFSEGTWPWVVGPGRDRMEIAIHQEFENLAAAYEWAEDNGQADLAGRIAEGLHWHWADLGHVGMSIEFLNRALETCRDPVRQAVMRSHRSRQLFNTGDLDATHQDAVFAYQVFRDQPASAQKENAIAWLASFQGMDPRLDPSIGVELAREALDVALEIDDAFVIARATHTIALCLAWAGRGEEAYPVMQKAVALAEKTGDPSLVASTYNNAATVGMQVAEHRREALTRYTDLLVDWVEQHPTIRKWIRGAGQVVWAMVSRGELNQVGQLLDREASVNHLEGYDKLGDLVPRATAVWMLGRHDQALSYIAECEGIGVNARWNHDFYPLKADVMADLGRLQELKTATDAYLGTPTNPVEEALKLGALNPQVRALVEAALGAPDLSSGHREAAVAAYRRMEDILAEHPPPMTGSFAMETPETHRALAEAELSRLDTASPDLWTTALEAADFAYFRLYAQIRLGEALLATGQEDEAKTQLEPAVAEARRVGARRLVGLAQELLSG